MKGLERVFVLLSAHDQMFNAAEWLHSPAGILLRKALAGVTDKEKVLDALWNNGVLHGFDVASRVTKGRSLADLENTKALILEVRAETSGPTLSPYQFTLLAFAVQCDPVRYLARVRDVTSASELGQAFGDCLFWPSEAMVILTTPLVQTRGKSRETSGLFDSVLSMGYQMGRWVEPDAAARDAARARLNGCSNFSLLSRNQVERETIAFLLLAYCGWIPLPLSGDR